MWVKSWYFDVENNNKYVFSRRLFFHWLKSLSGCVLSDLAVTKISLWIKMNLDPYSTYSLNYHRLHINGFSARTTSTAESMHNSMKCDGGLGKNIEASNASDISRTRTVETFDRKDRGHYLTNYAYKKVEEELLLSRQCRAVQTSSDTYNVYTPDVNQVKGKMPPSFYRLRKVLIVKGCFAHCSCGLPSRMKYPCRHILSITNEYLIKNFGIRWLNTYQFAFGRKGHDEMTNILREIEKMEFDRGITSGEVIPLELTQIIPIPSNFPFKLGDTTEEDVQNIKMMIHAHVNNVILVRGYTIKEQLEENQLSDENLDGGMHVSFSQESSEIFCADQLFLSDLQKLQQNQITESNLICKPRQDEIVATLRQSMKIAEGKDSIMEYCKDRIDQLLKDVTSMVGGKRKQQLSDIVFPYTGICKKMINARDIKVIARTKHIIYKIKYIIPNVITIVIL